MRERLDAASCFVLVIDLQERLVPAMAGAEMTAALRAARVVVEGARPFDVPVLASEQYPKGLGSTVPEVASLLPSPPLPKLEFSAWANPELRATMVATGRRTAVLLGVEAHVCVLQTALDLLHEGYVVHVVADGVASRSPADRATALELLRGAGAVITVSESVVFQWCGRAGTDAFKVVSRLVR